MPSLEEIGGEIISQLDLFLLDLPQGLGAADCGTRLTGILHAVGVKVMLLKAGTSVQAGQTDSPGGVRRAVLFCNQPEAAGKRLMSGRLPFLGYEDLWLDLGNLTAQVFLEKTSPKGIPDMLAAVCNYLFVPGSVVAAAQKEEETVAQTRTRLWCWNNLPTSAYAAHKRPGRKSTTAQHRINMLQRKSPTTSVLA